MSREFLAIIFLVVAGTVVAAAASDKSPIFPCAYTNHTHSLSVRCEGTGLAATASAFLRLESLPPPPVDEVVLLRGRFGRLYGNLLHSLAARVLRVVDTPLEQLDAPVFHGLNRTLLELHLVNTSLASVPFAALADLGRLTDLRITGGAIANLTHEGFAGTLLATSLQRLAVVDGVVANVSAAFFAGIKKLKTIDLHGNRIETLTRNQFRGMRDVDVLDLSRNLVRKLDASHIGDLTNLVWCNVSDNLLTEISRGAFAKNAVLRVLNLSGNRIKRLDTHSFRGMRFLRRLYLRNNSISDVNRGTFGNVRRIGTIDLAQNQLTKIDFDMFAQLNYVEIIDVSENNITQVVKKAFQELYLVGINMSHNAIETMEAGAFENVVNMTYLDLSHNLIETIGRKVFDENSYAGILDLSFNRIREFHEIPLANMTGLRSLNVSYNAIESVSKATKIQLHELHTIDLSHNRLAEMADNVFSNLVSLRSLNFSHNLLEKIRASTFGPIPTLLELDLSHNRLTEVKKEAFLKLLSLRELRVQNNSLSRIFLQPLALNELNFSHNAVEETSEEFWSQTNALLTLDLSHNRLGDNIKGGSMALLGTLRKLDLSSNNITRIASSQFFGLGSLQNLSLADNQITDIQTNAFGKLPIFELILRRNRVRNISEQAFIGLTHLSVLDLAENAVRQMPSNAFEGLFSLRQMDMSQNALERLDDGKVSIFEYCLNLRELNLARNNLTQITKRSFPASPYTKYHFEDVDLSFNKLHFLTNDLVLVGSTFKRLNFSYNGLKTIRDGILEKLEELEALDLSHNILSSLGEKQPLPPKLAYLDLSSNRFDDLPWDTFLNLSHLRQLYVPDNQLSAIPQPIISRIDDRNLALRLAGNRLHCDCTLRPLINLIHERRTGDGDAPATRCHSPAALLDQRLAAVPEESLACLDAPDREAAFPPLSDVKLRRLRFAEGRMFVDWILSSSYRDVADFYLAVREVESGRAVYEQHLLYDERQANVSTAELAGTGALEVCVLAKDSRGAIGKWFGSQCARLPSGWPGLDRRCQRTLRKDCEVDLLKRASLSREEIVVASAPSGGRRVTLTRFLCVFLVLSVISR